MKWLRKLPWLGFLHKIFNKLFLVYLLSYLVSMAVLGYALSAYLEQTFVNREVEYMSVAAGEAIDYIDGTVKLADSMIFNTYIECFNDRDLSNFMSSGSPDEKEFLYRKTFASYVNTLLNGRNDLRTITYYRNADKSVFNTIGAVQRTADSVALVNDLQSSGNKFAIRPMVSNNQASGYYYVKQFNSVFTWRPIGCFVMDFKSDGLATVFTKYTNNFNCDFVITAGDSVIYEMNGRANDGQSVFPSDQLSTIQNNPPNTLITSGDQQFYVIQKSLKSLDVKVYCVIPRSEIKKYVWPTQATVIIATLVVGLLFVIALSIGNRVFSHRMNALIEQIGRIRKGDFTAKSKASNKADELGIISSHFNEMCRELQEHINKTYRYELKQKDAEYQLLQMQINPHFLFNTLEAIRMKAAIEEDGDASQMIYNLSLLLRQTTKPTSVNTLNDEIAFCERYLDLFALKFKQGLLHEFRIARDCEDCGVIRHILQPLLENSIVHGFLQHKEESCKVTLEARRDGDDLLIVIQDNGTGMSENDCAALNASLLNPSDECADEGIGLHNVNDRIRFIYGDGYGITLKSQPGWGTIVSVRLKYLSYQEVMKLVQPADR